MSHYIINSEVDVFIHGSGININSVEGVLEHNITLSHDEMALIVLAYDDYLEELLRANTH